MEKTGDTTSRRVLETVLAGGWLLSDQSVGSMRWVACQKEHGGSAVVIVAGNWTFIECRFRGRPGPHLPGQYTNATKWLGGNLLWVDRRSEAFVSGCYFGHLAHRVRIADFVGVGCASNGKLRMQKS